MKHTLVCGLAVLGVLLNSGAFVQSIQIEKIAMIDDAAPGGGKFVDIFAAPVCAHGEWIAFVARSSISGRAIFRWSPHSFERVVSRGDAAPGIPGATFFASSGSEFPTVTVNRVGSIAFSGRITGPGVNSTNNDGIWLSTRESIEFVARKGDVAPGTSPTTVFGFLSTTTSQARPRVDHADNVVFSALLSGPDVIASTQDSIYRFDGSLDLLIRGGDPAPGTNGTFRYVDVEPGLANGSMGVIADMNDQSIFEGVWIQSEGSLDPAAVVGIQVPGFPEGTTILSFSSGVATLLSEIGTVAVQADLAGPGIDDTNSRSVWLMGVGSMELVARQGEQAAGLPPGVLYGPMFPVSISRDGRCAFYASVTGPGVVAANSSGLWIQTTSGIQLVARAGDTPPGMSAPDIFGPFNINQQMVAMNDRDQLVFTHVGLGPWGLWAWTPILGLMPIAVPGEEFEVEPGDIRVVSRSDIGAIDSNLVMDYSRNLDDSGWVPFRISFTGGTSGIFRARLPRYADLTEDNIVSVADLLAMINAWGACPSSESECVADVAPIGGDGVVNTLDILALISNWG